MRKMTFGKGKNLSRRKFIVGAAAVAGGGLALGLNVPFAHARRTARRTRSMSGLRSSRTTPASSESPARRWGRARSRVSLSSSPRNWNATGARSRLKASRRDATLRASAPGAKWAPAAAAASARRRIMCVAVAPLRASCCCRRRPTNGRCRSRSLPCRRASSATPRASARPATARLPRRQPRSLRPIRRPSSSRTRRTGASPASRSSGSTPRISSMAARSTRSISSWRGCCAPRSRTARCSAASSRATTKQRSPVCPA